MLGREREGDEATPHTALPHERVRVLDPEERGRGDVATSEDDVHSPYHRHQIEHDQTARVIVLAGLHFRQAQPLHSTLRTHHITSLSLSHTHTHTECGEDLPPICTPAEEHE